MTKEIICGIYRITAPNGKVYIGRSKDILKRFDQHKNLPSSKGLFKSFCEFGIDSHLFDVLEECEETVLSSREEHYITNYKDVALNERVNFVKIKPTIYEEFRLGIDVNSILDIELSENLSKCFDLSYKEMLDITMEWERQKIGLNLSASTLRSVLNRQKCIRPKQVSSFVVLIFIAKDRANKYGVDPNFFDKYLPK